MKFPMRRLLLVTGLAGLFLVVAAAASFWALAVQSEANSRSTAVHDQIARISFEDDALTDSGRLAVLTGDEKWLTRFDEGRARLTAAFEDLAATVDEPGVRAELEEVRDQSVRLRTLDRSVLALEEQGRTDEARSLLNSDEYVTTKAAFDSDVVTALAAFRSAIASEHTHADIFFWISWLFRILALATVALMVVLVVRMSRRWARQETNRLAGQLVEAEQWMGTAIERSRRGIGVIDPAAAAFKQVNARLAELLGKKPSDLLEPGSATEVLPETEDGQQPLEALLTGSFDDYEVEQFHRREGQDPLWLRWRLTALSGEGTSISVLADVVDVTARKLREEQLQEELRQDQSFAELVTAIDEGRLVLYRQPMVEISTGATTSYELLLRMDDGKGGLRTPDTFMPTAEQRGLSLMIDLWVIRQAAALVAGGMPVSVNISGASIGRPELLAGIREALRIPEFDPAKVIFEITETAAMTGWADGEALVKAIAELGAAVALDD
ncbi:MAG: EAL domain-containing protein, partial [Actinomycetia bacterium]|nr:EAL domain-containing protein [Actinomycetes bacterium]